MKQIIFLGLMCLMITPGISQNLYWKKKSPYELKLKKDLLISAVAGGVLWTGIYAEKNEALPNFQMGSLSQRDIDQINFLDRSSAAAWNVNAKDKGKIFKRLAKTGVPLTLIALPGDWKARGNLALMYFQGRALYGGLTALAKGSTQKLRPFAYLNNEQISRLEGEAREEFLEDVVDDDIEDSFFSGDASSTAFGLVFFAKVFNDYYPDSKWRPVVWGLSLSGVAAGSYFRVKSGKHFPTDVIVGSIVGGGIGYLIPHLHKKKPFPGLSIDVGLQGFSLGYRF